MEPLRGNGQPSPYNVITMTLTIQIPPETEQRLRSEAARLGVDEGECAKRLIELGLPSQAPDVDRGTLDLLAQWDREDETTDPSEIARRNQGVRGTENGIKPKSPRCRWTSRAEGIPVSRFIFLDSGPLNLLTQRRGVPAADNCRAWLSAQISKGAFFFVPEVVDYELRRELLRAGKIAAITRLDALLDEHLNHVVTQFASRQILMTSAPEDGGILPEDVRSPVVSLPNPPDSPVVPLRLLPRNAAHVPSPSDPPRWISSCPRTDRLPADPEGLAR